MHICSIRRYHLYSAIKNLTGLTISKHIIIRIELFSIEVQILFESDDSLERTICYVPRFLECDLRCYWTTSPLLWLASSKIPFGYRNSIFIVVRVIWYWNYWFECWIAKRYFSVNICSAIIDRICNCSDTIFRILYESSICIECVCSWVWPDTRSTAHYYRHIIVHCVTETSDGDWYRFRSHFCSSLLCKQSSIKNFSAVYFIIILTFI